MLRMRFHELLIRGGLLRQPKPNYSKACFELIVSVPSLVFLYRGMAEDRRGHLIAEFVGEMPWMNDDLQVFQEDLVRVAVENYYAIRKFCDICLVFLPTIFLVTLSARIDWSMNLDIRQQLAHIQKGGSHLSVFFFPVLRASSII